MKKNFALIFVFGFIFALSACLSSCSVDNTQKCTHKDENSDGVCDLCNEETSTKHECTDGNSDGLCDVCSAELEKESQGGENPDGNEDTETPKEPNQTIHNLERIAAKAFSCNKNGNIEYWFCNDCKRIFSDANAENEIQLIDTILYAAHALEGNVCTVCGYVHYTAALVFKLNPDNASYILTLCTSRDENIYIPEQYNGLPVTAIEREAFINRQNIKTITMPDTITYIGYGAFRGCTNLTDINLSKNLTEWGNSVFTSCVRLESVDIPEGITSIGTFMFQSCHSLTEIILPEGVTKIGTYAFEDCKKLERVTLGNKISVISDSAFSNCESLSEINLPESLTSIEWSAFSNCKSLAEITIPDGVADIDSNAFGGCSALKSITIPPSVTSIGGDAFLGCEGLEAVYINNVEAWLKISYPEAFWATLPNYLAPLYILDENGNEITELEIPDTITAINEKAFYNCKNITSIKIGKESKLTTIGKDAFANSLQLKRVIIENGLTAIKDSAFLGCVSLDGFVISDNVTEIGSAAFMDCSSLSSITIPDSVTVLGGYAFSGCTSLASAVIGNGVTKIDECAFEGCKNLTSVTISKSLSLVGSDVFAGCENLTDVYYAGSEEDWAEIAIRTDNTCLKNANIHYNYGENSQPEPRPEFGNEIGNSCPTDEIGLLGSSEKVSISDYRGKIVVINFWGTWCPPCVREVPHFDAVASEFADTVTVIAIHTSDSVPTSTSPEEFVETNYPDSKIVFAQDKPSADNAYLDDYYYALGGEGSYPMTVIVDAQGVITFKQVGAMTYDDLVSAINTAK